MLKVTFWVSIRVLVFGFLRWTVRSHLVQFWSNNNNKFFFKVFSLEKSCFSRVAQKIHQNVAILALPTFGTKLPVVDVRPCDELRFKKDKFDKLAESWTLLTFHQIWVSLNLKGRMNLSIFNFWTVAAAILIKP